MFSSFTAGITLISFFFGGFERVLNITVLVLLVLYYIIKPLKGADYTERVDNADISEKAV